MTTKAKTETEAGTVIAIYERPAYAGEGRGSETVGIEDLIIPRIAIVQALSPERKKTDANYIPGAEEGMMFNSVTRELYPDSLLVVPVFFRKEFFLWKLRKEGGGFRGVFPSIEMAHDAANKSEERVEIMDTYQQFVLVHNGVKWQEAVISMSGSNGTVAKKWNSDIKLRECDRFSLMYNLSAVSKTNQKGDFYIFKVEFKGWASKEVYSMGEQSYLAIKGGIRDVSRDYDTNERVPGSDDDLGF
jgi:hypothetical protein